MTMIIFSQAAWVNGRELQLNSAVLVRDGRIEAILNDEMARSIARSHEHEKIETGLLLPGFINAHCHLQYTHLSGLLPSGKMNFGDWLEAIIEIRAAQSKGASESGIKEGIQQLLAGGCTTVVDSTTDGSSAPPLDKSRMRYYLLHEVLGLSEERAKAVWESYQANSGQQWGSRFLGEAINPHSPYSVGPWLRERLRQAFQADPKLHCAWHLAESEEETLLLREGVGGIANFLVRNNMDLPMEPGSRSDSPANYLEQEELLSRCDLAFHGNELSVKEVGKFAAPRGLVHCPGTHSWFQRKLFPLREFIISDANICLGTDSLASSTSLSMWDQVKLVARKHPGLTGGQLINLATRNPGRLALFSQESAPLGIIEPGAAADFVALRCQTDVVASLRKMLMAEETCVEITLVAGEVLYSAEDKKLMFI